MSRRVNIFSTKIKSGKGGISTALIGYVEALRKIDIDLVTVTTHGEGSKLKCFFSAVKLSMSIEKHDICWFHLGPWFSMIRKLILIVICATKGGVICSHFHSPMVYDYLKKRRYKILISFILKFSDKIIVVAPWWKELLGNAYPEYQKKIFVSLNPIDSQLEELVHNSIITPPISKKEKTINILSVSRLVKGKGVEKTILALKRLPNYFTLTIAGSGTQEDELRQLVIDEGLQERVSFLGWINYENKLKLFTNASVFCLPSKLDSFGMVYLEALAANLPVVALNYQAIPDIVPSKYAVLCNDDDPDTLSKAIIKASNFNELNSARFILETYSADIVVDNLLRSINKNV